MKETPLDLDRFPDDASLAAELRRRRLGLKPDEVRRVREMLGHDPTQAELCLFDIEWSEHCSYKSSKSVFRGRFPTTGARVILGPVEDAGIVYLTTHEGVRYGLVVAHESHNHPSQVLPVEGAATGIGGIVRDVDCMGAHVIGVADPLRFGDPTGAQAGRTRSILQGVVDGIWQYGNALGVPNLGGDVFFDESFDDNCLVNVVAVGIVREDEIIRSRVPEGGDDYLLILVGKPTDFSGFGGAVFASDTLNDADAEANKGAVQVPDPFLKNVLLLHKANEAVRRLARERGVTIGMKDLGAGGIACAFSEICDAGGYGADIDLDAVHVGEEHMPASVILCAETQERYVLAVPPSLVEDVLRIYNEDWDLPHIYTGACARPIGHVRTDGRFVVRHQGSVVCDAAIADVTRGITYDRLARPIEFQVANPRFEEPADYNAALLAVLASPNICSREYLYRFYDTEVQGNAVLRPGEADATVIAPIDGCPVGVAVSVDGNPRYGKHSPWWGGATAVAEAMRNVAMVGAWPICLTDCLNFGNPEVPEAFWQFRESVEGIAQAAKELVGEDGQPVPIVSGNVSFYNQSAQGRSIAPSPIIACFGLLDDYAVAVSQHLKSAGNRLLLVGTRRAELAGSEYLHTIHRTDGGQVPQVRWNEERGLIRGTIECVRRGLVRSAHDISNGGLLVTLAEMAISGLAEPHVGLRIDTGPIISTLRRDVALFSESSGAVLEVPPANVHAVREIYTRLGVALFDLGETTAKPRMVVDDVINLPLTELREVWCNALSTLFLASGAATA